RVMARHRKIETPLPTAKPEIREMLEVMLDQEKPGEFAQAMMDLGATICSPKRPACALCPVNEDCIGFENGNPELYPFKQPKAEKPRRKGAAFVILNSKEQVFLCKRENTGLLAGMTQVPTTDWNSRKSGATGKDAAPLEADWKNSGTIQHTFTHFHLQLEVWVAGKVDTVPSEGWWCDQKKLVEEALPTVMRKVLGQGLGG
ncbi:MAG: NUDIX domain-containing protein, partial [Pseudomonadota bacterium]